MMRAFLNLLLFYCYVLSTEANDSLLTCNNRPTIDDFCTATGICFFTNTSCWTEPDAGEVRLPNDSKVLCHEAYDEYYSDQTKEWSDQDCNMVLIGLRVFCNCGAQSPTTTPTVPPDTPGIPAFCFSGSSLVTVKNRGDIRISELQIGDLVLSRNGEYEPVYSFGHRQNDIRAKFIKISTSTNNIEISPEHMLLTKDHGFIPASALRNENYLVDNNGEAVNIKSIKTITSTGIYAPFTPSGFLTVNGVIVSSFIAFENSSSMKIYGNFVISYQWLAHKFEFPHRVFCHYLSSCPNESYTDSGMSTWIAQPFFISKWMLKQPNCLLKNVSLSAFFTILLFFNLFEFIINSRNAFLALTAFVGLIVLSRRPMKVRNRI